MKIFLLPVLLHCSIMPAISQEVLLKDSIIYINNNPAAIYSTAISNGMQRYNVTIHTLNGKTAIEAELIAFTAPVKELRSFFYYELRFPMIPDTFSLYHDGEAFPLALAKIMADYRLLKDNKIDTGAVNYFKKVYPGGTALQARINDVTDYLNVTRNFDEQVIRDRTKPVSIINDRIIMQDGVKIGYINSIQNIKETNIPIYGTGQKSAYGQAPVNYTYIADYVMKITEETEIHFPNGRKIERDRVRNNYFSWNKKGETGYTLFEISKKRKYKVGSGSENLIRWICFLIEDYDL